MKLIFIKKNLVFVIYIVKAPIMTSVQYCHNIEVYCKNIIFDFVHFALPYVNSFFQLQTSDAFVASYNTANLQWYFCKFGPQEDIKFGSQA